MKILLSLLIVSGLFHTYTHINKPDSSAQKPNILWLVAEDLSPVIPSFGDSTIETPNLSRLAAEGICYDRVFSTSGVCAPSRAGIATGIYPTRFGANHMRTGPWFAYNIPTQLFKSYSASAMPPNIAPYEAILPENAHMLSEYLRMNGYYCSNNAKEDYQFRRTVASWDESSQSAHWRNRPEGAPFYSVFNFGITHESQIWERAKDSLWVPQDLKIPVPPYLPSTDSSLMDIRRMYSNIKIMDFQIGKLLAELEEDGLLENTIIFWYTDHGGPLPRQKRMLYDSGLRVPMIIRFPEAWHKSTRDDRLISFIDFAPTVLSLCGIKPPSSMDGIPFLGKYAAKSSREFIHAASDRFDESYDASRAVRDKQYKYIRNLHPERSMYLPIAYRDQMPIMRELHRLHSKGQLDQFQSLWFRGSKPEEELYDIESDPHEIYNLAGEENYKQVLIRMREEYQRWSDSFEDLNLLSEVDLIHRIHPQGMQLRTAAPKAEIKDSLIYIYCENPDAIIGYKWNSRQTKDPWNIYTGPFRAQKDTLLYLSHKLGYLPSDTLYLKNRHDN